METLNSLKINDEAQGSDTTLYEVTFDEKNAEQRAARQLKAKERMDAFQAAKIKARFEAHAAKRALKAKLEDPNESVDVFWERFKVRQESVNRFLDGVCLLQKKTATTPKAEVQKLIEEVDNVFPKIDEIQNILSTSAMFLPGFDRRTANTKISAMRQRAKDVKEQLQPRKRFSFKSKRKTAKKEMKTDAPAAAPEPAPIVLGSGFAGDVDSEGGTLKLTGRPTTCALKTKLGKSFT